MISTDELEVEQYSFRCEVMDSGGIIPTHRTGWWMKNVAWDWKDDRVKKITDLALLWVLDELLRVKKENVILQEKADKYDDLCT